MEKSYYQYIEKRKIIKIAVGALAAMVLIILAATVGSNLAQNNPVSIRSLEELQKIGSEEGYPLDGDYVLEADIDGGGQTIAAIGTEEKPFSGHFDGAGHTISGLTVQVAKVREIRSQEVVKEIPDDTGENSEKDDAKSEENNSEPSEEKEEPELVRLIISVDGYPLFEHTSDMKPGQIENLCLDGLKTEEIKKETKETASRKQPLKQEEPSKQEEKQQTEEKDNAASVKKTGAIKIHTWEEFKNIGNTKYNPAYTMDADYVLVKAIKSDGKKFTPIGTEKAPFTGTFDGQGRKIDVSANPEIDVNGANNGLFGTVKKISSKEDSNGK